MLSSLVGAGASLLGGVLDRNADKKAARRAANQVAPYNIDAGGYGIDVDQKTRQLTATMSPEQQQMYNLLGAQSMGLLSGGGPYAGYQQFSQNLGNNAMPGMFGDYMQASGQIPNQAFGMFGGQMGGMGNMALGGAQMGLDQAFAPGMNEGLSANLFNQGMGMQNMNVDNYRDVANNQLGLMRQLAAPEEARAADSMFQRLFSKGQMGSSAGGRNMEAFAQGQSNADMQRQLQAQQFAEGLYRNDQQFALNRGQLGQGLLGMGFQGQANDMSRQFGMGQLGQGLLGQAGDFAGQQLQGAIGQSDMVNQRSLQRLTEAQKQLFGGAGLFGDNQNNALNLMGAQNNMQQNLYNLLGMSGNLGSGQASAASQYGRLVGQGSPWSGFIEGVGSAISGMMKPTGAGG